MAQSAFYTSTTGSSLNISAEATADTYTAGSDLWLGVQGELSAMNGAAATLTVVARKTSSGGTQIGEYYFAEAKRTAADTTYSFAFQPIFLASGEKLVIRLKSSNASDTAVTWKLYWINSRSVDLFDWMGTATPTPNTAGYPLADVQKWLGGTIPAPATTGVPAIELRYILGTILTETSGLLAAAFKKFFNVATPTGTVNSLPDAVPDASGGLPITGTRLTAIGDTRMGNLDATVSSRLASASYTAPDNTNIGTAATQATNAASQTTAANIRVAVGMASANLDTQLAPIANLPSAVKKNTARRIPFKMVLASDHVTAATGLTVVAKRSLDGAAFATCAGAVTEISLGWYYLDAATGDLNGDSVALNFSVATADNLDIMILTEP